MYGLSAGTQQSGRCREVTVSRGTTVRVVRLLSLVTRPKGCLTKLAYLIAVQRMVNKRKKRFRWCYFAGRVDLSENEESTYDSKTAAKLKK